jgi:hypothetical protein
MGSIRRNTVLIVVFVVVGAVTFVLEATHAAGHPGRVRPALSGPGFARAPALCV